MTELSNYQIYVVTQAHTNVAYITIDFICNCLATKILITGYGMSVGDHKGSLMMKGGAGQNKSVT